MKSKSLLSAWIWFAIVMPMVWVMSAQSVAAGDDVFLDEGTPDFDSVPTFGAGDDEPKVKPAEPSKSWGDVGSESPEAKKPAKAAKKVEKKAEKVVAPVAAKIKKESPYGNHTEDDNYEAPAVTAAQNAESAQEEAKAEPMPETQPAAKQAEFDEPTAKPAVKERTPANTKPKQAAKAKSGAGIYVTTKSNCPMTREPASESPVVITVKPSKKEIWVEEVDQDWVRGFNKAGEAGYINRGCLE